MRDLLFRHTNRAANRDSILVAFLIAGVFGLSGCAGRPIASQTSKAAPAQGSGAEQKAHSAEISSAALEAARKNTARAEENSEASAEYHFSLAQAYVAEGSPDRAIEEYKLALMFDPNSALIYARLATEYVKKGMLSDAMATCKEALQRDPKYIDARLMLAGLYSTMRESDEALREYDRVLAQDPKQEEAVVYKAQVLGEAGKSSEAVHALKSFLKTVPGSAMVWYYLGRVEQSLSHPKEAITAYQKALAIKPGFTQAALAMGFYYEEQGKNAEAINVYKNLFDDSQDLSAANRIATILLKQEKYPEAIPYLEAIGAADPEDMNARVKLGLVYMELKSYDKALAHFKVVLEKNPDSDRVHFYVGSIYEETKQYEQAIAELNLIKPQSNLYSDAALHVGYLVKQVRSVADAKKFITDAIAKAPDTVGFYLFLASLEDESKDLPKSVAVLEQAKKRFPQDEKVLYYLGSLFDRMGDSDKGIEQMEAILAVNPENVDALNYIGYTWTTKGIRLGDAENLLKRALALKPDNGYIQDSWGYYLFVRGRNSEAIVELEKAVRMHPNEPTILEHLADAYIRSNLWDKAFARYTDAMKFADDESEKQKLETKMLNLQRELAQGGKTAPSRTPGQPSGRDRLPAGSSGASESEQTQ